MTNAKPTEPMQGTPAPNSPEVRLPHQAREVIGSRLRHLYGSLVAEPLPDRFHDLLVRLAAAESGPARDDDVPGQPQR